MTVYTTQPTTVVPVESDGIVWNAVPKVLMIGGVQEDSSTVETETISGVTSNTAAIQFSTTELSGFPHSTTDDSTPFLIVATFRPKAATAQIIVANAGYGLAIDLIYMGGTVYTIRLNARWRGNPCSFSYHTFPLDVPQTLVFRGVWSSGYTYAVDCFWNGTKYSGTLDTDPAHTPTTLDIGIGFGIVDYEARTATDEECFSLLSNPYQIFTDEETGTSASFAITSGDATFSGGATVRPITSFVVTAEDAVFAGAATWSASVAFSIATSDSVFSGGAVGDMAQGVISTPELKNNTGTTLASQTGITAYVYNPSTGALVVKLTGQTTNGSGVMTLTDTEIISGTEYRIVIVLGSGAEGMDKLTAS